MTKKIVSLLIALCMVLSVASAFAEKLTISYWDENFNSTWFPAPPTWRTP